VPRTFYRIIVAETPTRDDFLSHAAKRKPCYSKDPRVRRSWDAVSVFETEDQARRKATEFPRLGAYIAELEVPDVGPIIYERTFETPGHYDLRGEPDQLLACVVRVAPVKR